CFDLHGLALRLQGFDGGGIEHEAARRKTLGDGIELSAQQGWIKHEGIRKRSEGRGLSPRLPFAANRDPRNRPYLRPIHQAIAMPPSSQPTACSISPPIM